MLKLLTVKMPCGCTVRRLPAGNLLPVFTTLATQPPFEASPNALQPPAPAQAWSWTNTVYDVGLFCAIRNVQPLLPKTMAVAAPKNGPAEPGCWAPPLLVLKIRVAMPSWLLAALYPLQKQPTKPAWRHSGRK